VDNSAETQSAVRLSGQINAVTYTNDF